ncbi:lysozyme inhibitor LprI family protein [Pseudobutyrivibrio xylanivorans]|uniref:Lysozyme inhibitor LprI-like N-terminal domain-containing protein n=1 Tax=Pseudobutyrivibrio xylanivorans DSM 14809 TaxID=1123012 RepID=A0A1M6KTN5_PSEXY|nr:lysozyme inhibitor LprI family protein [Pseudobutyrivibrio xylanivorans]SHJ62341.1 Protein of unknown function [Pseudobutyrivibrio xylanivorans DSM 14809]
MKKRFLILFIAATMTFAACGKTEAETSPAVDSTVESTAQDVENTDSEDVVADGGNQEITDYTEQIKSEVAEAKSAKSLQEELDTIAELAEKYDELRMNSETQTEMNENSQWGLLVWDTELNSLWSRMSDELDSATKEEILAKQRIWVAMKDNAANHLSATYEGGSIWSMIYNDEQANITRRRAYVLANEYAKFKGEKFSMPARDNTGYFVDTQGTTDEYSSMTIEQGMEGDSLMFTVSLYRVGELRGYGEATSDGITFESEDGNVKASIVVSYDGASFTVDEATDAIVNAGESFDFDLSF